MFFQMLKQSLLQGRKQKGLAVLTIFFAASLITALLSISIDVGDQMAVEMKSYGANIQVLPKSENIHLEIGGVDYNPLRGAEFIPEQELPEIKQIFWRNNIVGLAPSLKTVAQVEGWPERSIPLIGTWFDHPMPIEGEPDYRTGVKTINAFWEVEGAWPSEEPPSEESNDTRAREALAGVQLAQEHKLRVGQTLTLQHDGGARETVRLVGLLKTGGAEEEALILPLSLVQGMTGRAGQVTSVSVSALTIPENELSLRAHENQESLSTEDYDVWYCSAYVSAITHQIEEALPNVSAKPIWQVAAGEGAVVSKIQMLLLVVTMAAFLSSGMGISSLMSATIMERAKEIGLMKALGAMDGTIYLLFFSEAAMVGFVGGVLGFVAGTGLAQVIGLSVFGSTTTVHGVILPLAVFVAILIALSGSVVPSRMIAKLLPVEVLHGRR